jgi:bifunctional non-homologous end joining protein LigD
VPSGGDWLHEVKFDGYRVQIHKAGKDVVIFSRNGHDFTMRFNTIAYLLRELPAKTAIVDGEIVASSAAGVPDFAKLHGRAADSLHLWCFDLLAINGREWRPYGLEKRQARLDALLTRFDCPAVLMSKSFDDGQALLRIAEKHKLEGIVSKRREASYRSGPCRDWRKIKTPAWKAANRESLALIELGPGKLGPFSLLGPRPDLVRGQYLRPTTTSAPSEPTSSECS